MVLSDARRPRADAYENDENDVVLTFEEWLDTASKREVMNNTLSLWNARPCDFLHISDQAMANGFAFWPDYLDWARLRGTSLEEWCGVVKGYFALLYRLDCGLPQNGRTNYLAFRGGFPALEKERETIVTNGVLALIRCFTVACVYRNS